MEMSKYPPGPKWERDSRENETKSLFRNTLQNIPYIGGGGYMWRLRARTALLQKPKSKAGGEGAHSTYIYDQKTKHATVVESHPNVAKGAPLGWGTPQPILLRADS